MKEPKISVVIPCYNYGKFLSKTLDSLLQQTYVNWECIIVDDGSVDDTREVASRYDIKDKRIIYLYQENAGQAAARNRGISHVTGEYVYFTDADDFIAPAKFEAHISKFLNNPDTDIVYGNVRYFHSDNPSKLYRDFYRTNLEWMPELSGRGRTLLQALIDRNILTINSALIKKTVLDTVGIFNESLRGVEDWDFWLRCAIADLFFFYDDNENAFAYIRIHDSSLSQKVGIVKKWELNLRETLESNLWQNKFALPEEIQLRALEINSYRIAQLNIQYLSFMKGWKQSARLLSSEHEKHNMLVNGFKSTVKRIIGRP